MAGKNGRSGVGSRARVVRLVNVRIPAGDRDGGTMPRLTGSDKFTLAATRFASIRSTDLSAWSSRHAVKTKAARPPERNERPEPRKPPKGRPERKRAKLSSATSFISARFVKPHFRAWGRACASRRKPRCSTRSSPQKRSTKPLAPARYRCTPATSAALCCSVAANQAPNWPRSASPGWPGSPASAAPWL